MTRKNLDGLNSSMNRSREHVMDEIPPTKVNMYKFLEYNRPPPTPPTRFKMRDNFMMNRLGSPMSRDANTIDYLGNQSVYSMEGSPAKDTIHVYDNLPPKSPTPPHLNMAPQSNYGKSQKFKFESGGHDFNHQSISHSLANMAKSLQDKIELEFKAQMTASKEELLFMQKEMTDKFRTDLKRASECADNLQKLEERFKEYKDDTTQKLMKFAKDIETLRAENHTLREEVSESQGKQEDEQLTDKAKLENLTQKISKLEYDLSDKVGSLEEQLSRDIKVDIEDLTKNLKQVEEKFTADFKNHDVSYRSLVDKVEDQNESIDKLKKDINKKLDKRGAEWVDTTKAEILKGMNCLRH